MTWLLGTQALKLNNPFASFTDIGLDPMTEFSVNQGVYAPNMPAPMYPFMSDDSFSNFAGFPGYGGFKYPTPLSSKPLNHPTPSSPMSQHPGFNGNMPPVRKPKQGRGGKPPNHQMRYNDPNNGNTEGNGHPERSNQPAVTLDIRGGGYKMENGKRRPYKAPSADSNDRDNMPRRPPSNGGRGNGGQRPRNKRPNQKSHRHRGPSMKNPYFNMKYEVSMPSMSHNVEFESPENVLPPMSPSMLMQMRIQKPKFNPFLYGSAGDIFHPSMMQSFFPATSFNGLKTVPGFYDSVKSAASQLLRGRKSQAFPMVLNPNSQISSLGIGIPAQSSLSTSSQLASQLALMQSNAEKVFGTLPQMGNEYLSQDPALYSTLAKTQGSRNLLAQIQQQQMQAIKALQSPLFQQQSGHQMESGGPLSQYLGSLDSVSPGSGQENGFASPHGTNYQNVNQGGEHSLSGALGLQHPKSQTSQAMDYQQMLLQQHSSGPSHYGYPSYSNSEHASQQVPGQMFNQKENYPLTVPHGSHQEYNSHPTTKGNSNAYSQYPYNPSDAGPSQGQPDYYSQQEYKHPKESQISYPEVNPTLYNTYSSDSKTTYPQTSHYHNQGQGDFRAQAYNDPNHYKSTTYQANNAGHLAAHSKDKSNVTPTLNSGPQSPYAPYSTAGVGNSLPYTQGDYQIQMTGPLQHSGPGQETSPVYSPSASKQTDNNYPSNYMSLYQQLAAMPSDPKFGFPVAAAAGSGNTEQSGQSDQKQGKATATTPQNSEGRDRAALHLPDDVSVFVSQNAQDKYMYQNYPEIYGHQNYYYQDSDRNPSDSDASESESEDKGSRGKVGDDGRSGRKKSTSGRTSDLTKGSKKPVQKTKSKTADSSTSSRPNQPVWTPTTTSKTATSEERKDQKAKNPSSYMIEYSPKDPTDIKTTSSSKSQSQSVQKTTTAKSDIRKYHSPVPAQQSAKSSSKANSERKPDDDFPFCARYTNTTYCLQDPEYPKEEIKDAIEKNRHPMDHFLVDISASASAMEDPAASSLTYSFEGNVVSSSSDFNNGSSGCPSKVYYSKPLRAINTSGHWKIIVNVEFGDTGANYTQTVRLEECVNQKDGAPSSCGVEPISACIQQYKLYRLLSWEKDKGFSIDAFLLPISCLCGNTISTTPTST